MVRRRGTTLAKCQSSGTEGPEATKDVEGNVQVVSTELMIMALYRV